MWYSAAHREQLIWCLGNRRRRTESWHDGNLIHYSVACLSRQRRNDRFLSNLRHLETVHLVATRTQKNAKASISFVDWGTSMYCRSRCPYGIAIYWHQYLLGISRRNLELRRIRTVAFLWLPICLWLDNHRTWGRPRGRTAIRRTWQHRTFILARSTDWLCISVGLSIAEDWW